MSVFICWRECERDRGPAVRCCEVSVTKCRSMSFCVQLQCSKRQKRIIREREYMSGFLGDISDCCQLRNNMFAKKSTHGLNKRICFQGFVRLFRGNTGLWEWWSKGDSRVQGGSEDASNLHCKLIWLHCRPDDLASITLNFHVLEWRKKHRKHQQWSEESGASGLHHPLIRKHLDVMLNRHHDNGSMPLWI